MAMATKSVKNRDQHRNKKNAITAQEFLAGKKIVGSLVSITVTTAAPVRNLSGTSTAEPWFLFDLDAFGIRGMVGLRSQCIARKI